MGMYSKVEEDERRVKDFQVNMLCLGIGSC